MDNMHPNNNFEEMYMVLYGASKMKGAKYEVIKRWFTECDIIDGEVITERFFESTYARVRENNGPMTMAQFINFVCLLAREAHKDIDVFFRKFDGIRQDIIKEINDARK